MPDPRLEFTDVREGLTYSMNTDGILFFFRGKGGITTKIKAEQVHEILSASLDFAERYGLKDSFGREINLDSFIQTMRNLPKPNKDVQPK